MRVPLLAAATFLLAPVAGAAAACPGAGTPYDEQSPRQYARAVRCLLNEQRAAAGLTPLAADRRLTRAAERFSRTMVQKRFFAHVSPEGDDVGDRVRAAGGSGGALGETIAWAAGAQSAPAGIVGGWMSSAGHRSIILDGRFREVGLGVAGGSPSGTDGATVTADFGT